MEEGPTAGSTSVIAEVKSSGTTASVTVAHIGSNDAHSSGLYGNIRDFLLAHMEILRCSLLFSLTGS